MSIPIRHYACTLFLVALTSQLQAQEIWDSSIQLVLGSCGAAEDASFSQKTNFGVSLTGAYPVWDWGGLVFEGGYRIFSPAVKMVLNNATPPTATGSTENKASGLYGGAWLRYKFPQHALSGAYAQAGFRAWQMAATEIITRFQSSGANLRSEVKGSRALVIKPMLGVGYRFTDRLSGEFVYGNFGGEDINKNKISGTIMEFSLGIHL